MDRLQLYFSAISGCWAGLAEHFPDKYDIYEVVLVCGNASLKRIRLKSREKQQ